MAELIERTPTQALARLDPQALISQAITAGADIQTMERLVALATTVRAMQAKESYHAAMAEFQATCPPIYKTDTAKIQTARGQYSYSYAPTDEILTVIRPVLGQLGLSISWRRRIEGALVASACIVSHQLGHSETSGEVVVPIEKSDDGRGASPAQRVGIAMTYADRYALRGVLGLVPEDKDTDGAGDTHNVGQASDSQGGREPADSGSAAPAAVISEGQVKRLWAIGRGAGWSEDAIKALEPEMITKAQYAGVIDTLKAGPAK